MTRKKHFPAVTGVTVLFTIMIVFLFAFTPENEFVPVTDFRPAPGGDTEEVRFTKIVLAEKLDEPIELAVLDKGRILFIERHGKVKLYDPVLKKIKTIATIPVSSKYTDSAGKQSEAEDGLLGVALDPNYKKNHWIYFYYSPAGKESKNILTRYELIGDNLKLSSKKVILEVPVQREQCCHTGGSIDFDAKGNLYVSTGDNTSPRSTLYAPIDERPGRGPWDAQKSSGNTNDLRGKIIRIHPEANGSYTIPDGNLFPKGMEKTRPEIFTMGHRNPYRISVDKKTGYVYWGDVGPDAGKDSITRGPKSYDEFGQARQSGNFGWPYFVADNKAYWYYDFAATKSGEKYDPEKPVNHSPNNTGLEELPAAQKAFIWYPYERSSEFPLLGQGGRSAMAGPVFYSEDFKTAKRSFPAYYNGKLFIYEWMRDWVIAVTMDSAGNYISMERFMPNTKFSHPIDMSFAPDGDLYLLEYGQGWFMGNPDARLVRIEYNSGVLKPLVKIDADKKTGALPLAVNFNSTGTKDLDKTELKYEWKIISPTGTLVKTFSEPNPSFTFSKPGKYKAALTVTNAKGIKSNASLQIKAGNEQPQIDIDITNGNKSFFIPNQAFEYAVRIKDKEDGELGKGVSNSGVRMNIKYLPEGLEDGEVPDAHKFTDILPEQFLRGRTLLLKNDCKSCHATNKKVAGPSYQSIAKKYKSTQKDINYLINKVINGGSGVWGDVAMAAHPQITKAEAAEIIKYVLNTTAKNAAQKPLPPKGKYIPKSVAGSNENAVVILRAAYTDKGAAGATPLSAEKILVLKNPKINAATASRTYGIQKFKMPDPPLDMAIAMRTGAYLVFSKIDLSAVEQITFAATAPVENLNASGGKIEVHLDSETGPLIGETEKIEPASGSVTEMKPVMLKAAIKPTEGIHDLYFVFRNEGAAGALFVVFNIEFGK